MRTEYNKKEQCHYIYHDVASGDIFNGWWKFQPCAFYDNEGKLFADDKAGFKDFGFINMPSLKSAIEFLQNNKVA
jgi:hypothetical protein